MAMFLSRLKQILNLGTKSITTNGTYTASSDGYDGYSQVTVNVPSSPSMGLVPSNLSPYPISNGYDYHSEGDGYAIESYDDVTPSSSLYPVSSGDIVKFGGNGVVLDSPPTPSINITPSNSNPEFLQVGIPFKVTTNGFAVESIDDVTPTSIPASVSVDDIVHIQGSGVIVDSIPTPPSITPSNANPAQMTIDTPVNPAANGYAIESYDSVTPTSTPTSVSSGDIVKIGGSGKIVDDIYNVSPYDIIPPHLSNGLSFRIQSTDGYLYKTIQPKVKIGTCTNSSSSVADVSVTLDFKPKYLCIWYSSVVVLVYDERRDTTRYFRCTSTPAFDNRTIKVENVGNTLQSIDDDGFTIRSSANKTWNYFAIG